MAYKDLEAARLGWVSEIEKLRARISGGRKAAYFSRDVDGPVLALLLSFHPAAVQRCTWASSLPSLYSPGVVPPVIGHWTR
jgi:hypothetical protein